MADDGDDPGRHRSADLGAGATGVVRRAVGARADGRLVRRSSADPAEVVASSDSLTLGFLRVLETLDPTERAVFLLHDVFAVPFAEVAVAVDRNEAATRQMARRAREKVRDGRPRLTPPPAEVRELSDAFLAAILEGDVDRLTTMLTDDVVHISDGGPDHHAARRPVRGPDKVARLFVNLAVGSGSRPTNSTGSTSTASPAPTSCAMASRTC